jgi:hypothetical protein
MEITISNIGTFLTINGIGGMSVLCTWHLKSYIGFYMDSDGDKI